MKLAVTGHRPDKLFGYNLRTIEYYKLASKVRDYLIENHVRDIYCGGALGFDTLVALTVLKLRDNAGMDIKLHLALPVPPEQHVSKWVHKEDIDTYYDILNKSDSCHVVSSVYTPYCMQKRNEYMVDHADVVLACWDGTKGGTGNCVKYAHKKNKKVDVINPKEIRL